MPEATPVDDRPPEAVAPDDDLGAYPTDDGSQDFPDVEPGGVTEDQAAAFWANFGTIVHRFGPTPEWAPDAWLLTDAETRAMAIPSTEIANRRAPVIAAVVAQHSAEVALGILLVGYFKSNLARIRPPEEGAEPPPAPVFPTAVEVDEEGRPVEAAEPMEPPAQPAPDIVDEHTRPYFEQPGFGG